MQRLLKSKETKMFEFDFDEVIFRFLATNWSKTPFFVQKSWKKIVQQNLEKKCEKSWKNISKKKNVKKSCKISWKKIAEKLWKNIVKKIVEIQL